MKGIAYGVGVGPGDPKLMTLRAIELIRENDVIAVPGKEPKESVAYKIAAAVVPEIADKELVPVYMPMIKDRALIDEEHKKGAALLKKYREQITYLVVGGLTTLVSLATYFLCTKTFLTPEIPLQLQAANVISWICAVAFAYVTNRKYVFRSREENKALEAGKFVLSRVSTLLMEMAVMWLVVTVLGINDRIVKIAAQVIVIIANYVLSKLLVFRKKERNA